MKERSGACVANVGPGCDDSRQAGLVADVAIANSNLDGTAWVGINDAAPVLALPGSPGPSSVVPADPPNPGTCLTRAQFANGLYTGQYLAPIGEFIYPENTLAGRPIVPANFYQQGFLVYGESGVNGNSTAAQAPLPW